MLLQRLAALVDRDRILEGHVAALELLYDLLELGERLLEWQGGDRGTALCVIAHRPVMGGGGKGGKRQDDASSGRARRRW